MKKKYYVNMNRQNNGDYEVHEEGCRYMPNPSNRIYLGEFTNCRDAVTKAKKHYNQVNGCFTCCNPCHTY